MPNCPNISVVGPGGLVEHVQQQCNMHIQKCCILSTLEGSGDGVLGKPVFLHGHFIEKATLNVQK